MDEKLTDGMNEALWHIIEHGNLDVLIIEMVSIVPSFLGLMNDILHSNRYVVIEKLLAMLPHTFML